MGATSDLAARGTPVRLYHLLVRIPWVGPAFRQLANRVYAWLFVRDLQRLHDTLAGTGMAGRYWVWGGLLLGWARDAAMLPGDRDADFAMRVEDLPALEAAIPALRAAGFRQHQKFRNNDGEVTELTFQRHRTKYEFFLLRPGPGGLRYFVYGWPPDNLVQVEAEVPDQPLTEFAFLGRTWLKHADHDLELTHLYGDWRTPNPDWNYLDDIPQGRRAVWVNPDVGWG